MSYDIKKWLGEIESYFNKYFFQLDIQQKQYEIDKYLGMNLKWNLFHLKEVTSNVYEMETGQ